MDTSEAHHEAGTSARASAAARVLYGSASDTWLPVEK